VRAPDITYRFASPSDTAGLTLEILSRQFQLSAGQTLIEFFVNDIPKDRVLILQNYSLSADPGGGLIAIEVGIQGITQAGLNFPIAFISPPQAANQILNLNGEPSVWIQGAGVGNNTLRMFALFSASTSANQLTVGINGLIIPHGNVGAF